jgi:hypothetical protein
MIGDTYYMNTDNLYPKYKCNVCGDWFHMPFKYCKCDMKKQHENFNRKIKHLKILNTLSNILVMLSYWVVFYHYIEQGASPWWFAGCLALHVAAVFVEVRTKEIEEENYQRKCSKKKLRTLHPVDFFSVILAGMIVIYILCGSYQIKEYKQSHTRYYRELYQDTTTYNTTSNEKQKLIPLR